MGLIQDFIRRMREGREEKSSFARSRFIEEDFERRKLSADERELMRFHEEDRKKAVKAELERRRKIMQRRIWSGHDGNPIDAPNVTSNHKKLFSSGNDFAKVPSVVKTPNVVNVRNIFKNG